jgi:predicted small secreted protein
MIQLGESSMSFKDTKKAALICLVLLTASILAGCNTIQGVGKDVQRGGQAIERVGK